MKLKKGETEDDFLASSGIRHQEGQLGQGVPSDRGFLSANSWARFRMPGCFFSNASICL